MRSSMKSETLASKISRQKASFGSIKSSSVCFFGPTKRQSPSTPRSAASSPAISSTATLRAASRARIVSSASGPSTCQPSERSSTALLDAPQDQRRLVQLAQARIESDVQGLRARQVLRPHERRIRDDLRVEARGVARIDQRVGQRGSVEDEILAQEGLALFAGRAFARIVI